MGKLGDCELTVAPYPVAWRAEVVDDEKYRGFEFIRLGPGVNKRHGVFTDST